MTCAFLLRGLFTMVIVGTMFQPKLVDALTCYQCFSLTDYQESCESFNPSSVTKCTGASSCYTTRGTTRNGGSAVLRGCLSDPTRTGCVTGDNVNNDSNNPISGSRCVCATDYCNTAHSTLRDPGFLSLIWAAAVASATAIVWTSREHCSKWFQPLSQRMYTTPTTRSLRHVDNLYHNNIIKR
jgi:hypothetical protein